MTMLSEDFANLSLLDSKQNVERNHLVDPAVQTSLTEDSEQPLVQVSEVSDRSPREDGPSESIVCLYDLDPTDTWTPPIFSDYNLRLRVDALLGRTFIPIDEHIREDEYIVLTYTMFNKKWPEPDDVVNDVIVARSILSLIILTTSPRRIPIRPEWRQPKNIVLLAEQPLVRARLRRAVQTKRFARWRSLCIWYEGCCNWF